LHGSKEWIEGPFAFPGGAGSDPVYWAIAFRQLSIDAWERPGRRQNEYLSIEVRAELPLSATPAASPFSPDPDATELPPGLVEDWVVVGTDGVVEVTGGTIALTEPIPR
jgi:hypothetical protein